MPNPEMDKRLVAAGFMNVGVPINIRYCCECRRGLAPFRQWHKALELNQPQKCFCRRCALKLVLEIENARAEVYHCPTVPSGDEQPTGRPASGDPVPEAKQDHAPGRGKFTLCQQAARAWRWLLQNHTSSGQ